MTRDSGELDRLFERARAHLARAADAGADAAWRRLQERRRAPALRALVARRRRFEAGTARPRLADRRDLLLLLLRARGAAGVTGMTRLMKLAFVAARELGLDRLVRDPWRFQPYRLGPFAAEVYDDLDTLADAGLVERRRLDEDGEPVIQRDERMARELRALNHGLAEAERLGGLALHFRLTPAGAAFADALAGSARRRDPRLEPGLALIAAGYGGLPLRALLRRIYRRWPEFTTASVVREKLFGKKPGAAG
jgi:hypothetical protein